MLNSNILLIVTGSISVYKSLDIVSKLKKDGHKIKVVMTSSSQKFVTPLTFSAISGGEVYTDLFDAKDPMTHIDLARWADKIIVAPATANFINKLACGMADDLASNIYLAHKFDKPFYVYPAMNTAMLKHPQTVASLDKLKSFGVLIGDTDAGVLACGEVGEGKLLHIDSIYQQISSAPKAQNKKIRVLITSGGTQEPIDGVRHIGNMSSGRTGTVIASALLTSGVDVTFFHAKDSIIPNAAKLVEFTSFDSLCSKLEMELSSNSYDCIIHLAAISDFSVDYLKDDKGNIVDRNEKLSSSINYSIHLKKNPKIISMLKGFSKNKNIRIIAFKLTNTESQQKQQEQIQKVFINEGVDFVVHNELNEINHSSHRFSIYSRKNKKVELETKEELAMALIEILIDAPKLYEVRL